ncbi:Transcription factor [Cordyceps fumosorosea ARSEF 2679]|uniref:Transcription factor n=1 Tax=Cordyceps fumosorosea (strain ARSEF 2679) TaxID=1081104 RepID=A0A168DGV2_CORFA|nr:Transcription factor [Cordyceps fumosorosea ARSEF 2679]OAA72601.1 Transcription factor [Cordyceps fumosorosea ARSEF 2679]
MPPPAAGSLPRLLPKPSTAQERRQPASLPRKRQPVSNACNSCRTRKTKVRANHLPTGSSKAAWPPFNEAPRQPTTTTTERDGTTTDVEEHIISATAPGLRVDNLRKERTENFASIVELIRRSNGVSAEEIARRIREADNVDTTISDIADASMLLQSSAPPPPPPTVPAYPAGPYPASAPPRPLLASPWTTVSTDDRHMNHLLNLFFTWDNVVERIIYRPVFEEDVRHSQTGDADADADGDTNDGIRLCSRFLVNSLLALGCLYSMDPATYKTPGDSPSRGRLWADEAELLLQQCSQPSIPLMQGLYALFVYEGNLRSGQKSIEYFFRCMEMHGALDESLRRKLTNNTRLTPRQRREREAISWCMWGLYCYEWRSTEALGLRKLTRQPSIAKLWRESDFSLRQSDCVGYWWYPYPISLQAQPSMQVAVREADVALSLIVERILDYLHPEVETDTALTRPRDALELYNALAAWKYQLPDELRFENAVLPSVFLLHIALEVMYIAILRPFAHTTKERFGRFDPHERCAAHASHVVTAIWTFRAYGQLRYEYYLVHPLGTACYIMLQDAEAPVKMDSLVRACQCLYVMRTTLPLAVDVLSGVRAAFYKDRLTIPTFMARYFNRLEQLLKELDNVDIH